MKYLTEKRIEKILEETQFDKQLFRNIMDLFLTAINPLEVKLKKALDLNDSEKIYEMADEIMKISEVFLISDLKHKCRDIQMLSLHNNLSSPIMPKLRKDLFSILLELKEEMNYILDQ